MNILMLNNEFPPLGGGTATVNYEVLRVLSNYPDISVTLITSAGATTPSELQFSDRIRIIGLPIARPDIHHASNLELLTYAFKATRYALSLTKSEHFDVCFAWCSVPAGAAAWVLKHLRHIPYVVRVSGPDIPGFETRYRLLYPFLTPLIRAIWRGAAALIAKSPGEAALIKATDPTITPHLIPNGVDAKRFHTDRSTAPHSPLRLLCVGRLIHRKRQDLCIEALALLHAQGIPATLTLVGTGDSEPELRAQVSRFNLTDTVTFRGYIPRSDMPSVYANHDIFLLPSENEGMSIALLEALASGLPSVVSGQAADGVTHDESASTIILSHLSPQALADGVRGLTGNWGGRAKSTAQPRMDWEKTAHCLLSLLKNLQ